MRNYWIAFILIISIGFFGLGMVVFKGFIQKPQPKLFYLNVDSMQMAAGHVPGSTDQRPVVISIFSCGKKNASDEAIPWADLYVCKSYNKSDSLSGDTALVFIDIHTKSGIDNIKDINHYGASVKTGQTFKKCKVMLPADQINNIRRYKYKFAQVTLVDDWLYD